MYVETTFKCSTCGREFKLSFIISRNNKGMEIDEISITRPDDRGRGCPTCNVITGRHASPFWRDKKGGDLR